jgi:serine/threonine protein kinase
LLRASVEALLQNHKEDHFLETPAVEPRSDTTRIGPGGTVRVTTVTEKAGDRIGRYKLLQEIGEGGCGTVYMAEQEEPVRRRVALKVIKLGMDTSRSSPLRSERQALAKMDHRTSPRSSTRVPLRLAGHLVMELVRGIRINEYCDRAIFLPGAARLVYQGLPGHPAPIRGHHSPRHQALDILVTLRRRSRAEE